LRGVGGDGGEGGSVRYRGVEVWGVELGVLS
jgi:hypothetical protein